MEVDLIPVANNSTNAGYNNKSIPAGPTSATAAEGYAKRGDKAFGAAAGNNGLFVGPSHVLFSLFAPISPPTVSSAPDYGASPTKTGENRQRCLRIDPRLERDYINKRKRAHKNVEWCAATTSTSTDVTAPWEGVSKVERELVDCCESLDDDFYSHDTDQETGEDGDDDETDTSGLPWDIPSSSSALVTSSLTSNPVGGVLAVEKETRFAAILSRGCYTIALRSLALAILERTLMVYLAEEATSAILLQQQQERNKNDVDDKNTTEVVNIKNETTTEPSQQSLRYQNRVKRLRLLEDEDGQNASDEATTTTDIDKLDISSSSNAAPVTTSMSEKQHRRRFGLFFAAGGLRILNQWLVDASSYDITKRTTSLTISDNCTAKSASSRNEKKNNKNTTLAATHAILKSHATRPIALSILLFLEHIPFEKKMVTNSKINKQIQKLGKKVALIKEAHQNRQAPKEDLDDWTTQKPIVHDEALTQILVAVDAVKASWREKAKTKGETKQPHPFGALQAEIKERLQVLAQFKSGTLSTRPEWYRPEVTTAAFKEKSQSSKRKAPSEGEIEKLNLQRKIKQVQSRSQKSLQQLREKLRQRKVEQNHTHSVAHSAVSIFSSSKKVAWKDGLNSQITRNRKMLEEVYIFGKDLPSSASRRDDNLLFSNQAASATIRRRGLGKKNV